MPNALCVSKLLPSFEYVLNLLCLVAYEVIVELLLLVRARTPIALRHNLLRVSVVHGACKGLLHVLWLLKCSCRRLLVECILYSVVIRLALSACKIYWLRRKSIESPMHFVIESRRHEDNLLLWFQLVFLANRCSS